MSALNRSIARIDRVYYTARCMAMGTRETEQSVLWVATSDLPKSPGHPFYTRLNALLDADGFDRFVEDRCQRFYAPVMGRPGLEPGRYFRLLPTPRRSSKLRLRRLVSSRA